MLQEKKKVFFFLKSSNFDYLKCMDVIMYGQKTK